MPRSPSSRCSPAPCGREAQERLPYSIGLVYNTFPAPPAFAERSADLLKLEQPAQAVLDTRATQPEATLADLYDPDLMPASLRKAHRALDRAIDRLYRQSGLHSERDRIKHLFMLYEMMRAPLDAASKGKPKRRRRKRLET